MSRLYDILNELVRKVSSAGKTVADQKKGISVPSNLTTPTTGATVDLDANSLYMIQISTVFPTATSTGATWHVIGATFGTANVIFTREIAPTNEQFHNTTTISLKTGDSAVTFTVTLMSNRVINNVDSQVYTYKLVAY